MSDFPDLADRALWRKLFAGQSVQLARHEVDLKEQYDAMQEIKRNDIKRAGDIDAALALIGETRNKLAEIQDQLDALRGQYDKLLGQLKVRFGQLRDELREERANGNGNSS